MTVCTGEGKQLHTLLSHPMLSEHWDFTRKMLINIFMHSSLFQSNLKMHIIYIYTTPIPHIFNEDKYYNILKLKNWETVTDRHREQKRERERGGEKEEWKKRNSSNRQRERKGMLTIDNDREQAVKQRLKPLVPCGDDLVEHLHNTAHKTPAQYST